jgi:MSHA biogenesis protein MshP
MSSKSPESGFTLITAIFLLVVVAGLVVYMANSRVVQQTTLLYGVQGARAMQAARSGIEWGIYQHQALGNACTVLPAAPTSTTITFPGDPALQNFRVAVQCSQSTHIEGGATPIITYQLTAIAESGSYADELDYVQRRIQASVSIDPP